MKFNQFLQAGLVSLCLFVFESGQRPSFNVMEGSAKTGEGISILQSTTDKFMVVLYGSLYLPLYLLDIGYGIPTGDMEYLPGIWDTYLIPDYWPAGYW